jgi:hypothetical protein
MKLTRVDLKKVIKEVMEEEAPEVAPDALSRHVRSVADMFYSGIVRFIERDLLPEHPPIFQDMKISDVLRQAAEYVDGSERDVIIYSREGLDQ